MYFVIAVSAFVVLFGLTAAIATILARALGERINDVDLGRQLGSPVFFAIVFGVVWWYHRRVVEAMQRVRPGCRAHVSAALDYLIAR